MPESLLIPYLHLFSSFPLSKAKSQSPMRLQAAERWVWRPKVQSRAGRSYQQVFHKPLGSARLERALQKKELYSLKSLPCSTAGRHNDRLYASYLELRGGRSQTLAFFSYQGWNWEHSMFVGLVECLIEGVKGSTVAAFKLTNLKTCLR